ncbi:MAG: Asp23/Gls24 family envelope stress response protein [Lachnospiraceae bacterium]|uniref:Asp23/Gls24 family envelope stress response protein n=1 Tax=Falcatimonas sp. MSJ-15 TaxID=2841515 RepID=UPI001C10A54B|nr:Asp23/Gls24 family envelope stress response protein [Falcatimonas sp. MSJ-15]MBQ5735980.1 Asp23/Gls24 family envelope stress response protein [Lachnospiraceae bacterium]MBU5471480.1 Asp23/Gls24 family envelope stress response protein [Falcatimonas sp. MSJ-15]MEE0958985.1 Asp23/Gls24 family envelope stress response protein [Lachnospiraceae bacterium]
MSKESNNRNTYKIHENGQIGEVQIADEVVAIIAGLAATEVEGVASMAGNITNELVSKLGMKNLSKGVKVAVAPGSVTVDLALNLEFGYSIPVVSAKVQDKVKSAIETMTGLNVSEVNIRIASVSMEKSN